MMWLAGLVEGEGCFTMIKRARADGVTQYVRFIIVMTDKDVMERVSRLLGQKIHAVSGEKEHHKTKYQLDLTGQRAVDFAAAMRPLMGKRRQTKIDELLAATHQTAGSDTTFSPSQSKPR